jgi:hypothetical protein
MHACMFQPTPLQQVPIKCLLVHAQGSLTPKLLCCESGSVDKCGVCDGDGSTCPTISTVHFKPLSSSSGGRRLESRALYATTANEVPSAMALQIATSQESEEADGMRRGGSRKMGGTEDSIPAFDVLRRLQNADFSIENAVERFKICICAFLAPVATAPPVSDVMHALKAVLQCKLCCPVFARHVTQRSF